MGETDFFNSLLGGRIFRSDEQSDACISYLFDRLWRENPRADLKWAERGGHKSPEDSGRFGQCLRVSLRQQGARFASQHIRRS